LTGQIRDARVAIVGEKRGISERRSRATREGARLDPYGGVWAYPRGAGGRRRGGPGRRHTGKLGDEALL
jgi:hypothetical protein